MGKKTGIICLALGFVCLAAAAGLVCYNSWQETNAQNISHTMLEDVQQVIEQAAEEEVYQEMLTAEVDGDECIGILSIPVLEIELPVLTDWSYTKLKKAPCHYYGSCYETDFVIAAHNYKSHFGLLSQLQEGDLVLFTDIRGAVHCYQVVLTETLSADATMEMITSGFDLSLYTCTTGGGSRVTVRCSAVDGLM